MKLNITERELKNFTVETHLLLGIEYCAECGSTAEGSTARCFECLEKDFEDEAGGNGNCGEITAQEWVELARRQIFYRQLERIGPANPAAQPRVLRFRFGAQAGNV